MLHDKETLELLVDAEQSVLSCVMAKPELIDSLQITEADFLYLQHAAIWKAFKALRRKDKPLNAVTVQAVMDSKTLSEVCKGQDPALFFRFLSEHVPVYQRGQVGGFEAVVLEESRRRAIAGALEKIGTVLVQGGAAEDVLATAQELLLAINTGDRDGPSTYIEALGEFYDRMEAYRNGDVEVGIATPWPDLERLTNGFKPGELVIIAGRPGMGKTAMMFQIALWAAKHEKMVMFESLEMSQMQMVGRGVSQDAQLSSQQQIALDDQQWQRFIDYIAKAADYGDNLLINDGGSFTRDGQLKPSDVRRAAVKQASGGGLDMLILDYVQLMDADGRRENRVQEMTQISRALKQIALALNIPVIIGAQLSRSLESRADKTPILSDLRESGSLEQDADMVIFIHREGAYRERLAGYEPEPADNIARFVLAKNRSGPTGQAIMMWQRETTQFKSAARKTVSLRDV